MTAAEYDAVVYDLDGTLVHLAVDWAEVAEAVVDAYVDAVGEAPSRDLWELLAVAPEYDLGDAVEETIAEYERAGAASAPRLARADELVDGDDDRPIGVCSLNCEAACRIALERHDLLAHVDVVVGRDTVATQKPDPEPLLHAARELSTDPERTLFVGDSPRDERTAERAGTAFEYVDGRS